MESIAAVLHCEPRNQGKIVGHKATFKQRHQGAAHAPTGGKPGARTAFTSVASLETQLSKIPWENDLLWIMVWA